jgi:CubicO group peptidase (beta-lactamase class C family)
MNAYLLSTSLLMAAAIQVSADCLSREAIEKMLNQSQIPGAVFVVFNPTRILYKEAFGYHSLAPVRYLDADKSIFTLGSISKTFIAIAVMQLVEQELVDLDTDINQYLNEPQHRIFHPRYPKHAITLRKLLSHSASIALNGEILLKSF